MKHSAVTLENCEQFIFPSVLAEYSYEICVSIPKQTPPIKGFPVHYVLDGSFYFQHARDVVKLQSRNTIKTQIEPAIVVGIGHAEETMHARRFYDFTAPAESYSYPQRLHGRTLGPHGGALKFIEFIEQELKPYIESTYPINTRKQSLFGHSLSGYFALWVLFTKPELFQVYLASSPSIWWNNHELTQYAQQYLDTTPDQKRLLLTVGEHEKFMVDDATALSQLLNNHHYPAELFIAPDENHASVVPTILSRAFRFTQ